MTKTPNQDRFRAYFDSDTRGIHFEQTCLSGLYGPMPDATVEVLNGTGDEADLEAHYQWLISCIEKAEKLDAFDGKMYRPMTNPVNAGEWRCKRIDWQENAMFQTPCNAINHPFDTNCWSCGNIRKP